MRLCARSIVSVLTLLFVDLSRAIYTDEAYQTDYHHALLGIPQAHQTFFHRPSAASKASLLYTLSDRNVLGAVNPRDGAVIWRQQLGVTAQNGSAQSLLKAREQGDILISAAGGAVQAWDATDGRLAWTYKCLRNIYNLDASQADGDVFVVSGDQSTNVAVTRLAASTGEAIWEFKDPNGDIPYAVVSSDDRVFYLSLHQALLKGFKIKVTELTPATGLPIGNAVLLSSENEVTSRESILHAGANAGVPYIVWTDKNLMTLKVNVIGTKQISNFNVPSSNKASVERAVVHAARSTSAKPHFLIHVQGKDSNWAEVYHVASGATKKLYDLPSLGGRGSFSAGSQGPDVYFTRHTADETILLSSADSSELSRWNIDPKSHSGNVDPQEINHAVSEVVSRGGSTYAVRSALALSSGDWRMVRNSDTLWIRPEGLAGAVAATFIDIIKEETLAEELAAEGESGPLSAYLRRIKRHGRDLQYFPAWAEALPRRLLSSFLGDRELPQDQEPRRDGFGFHKMVLVATEQGKVIALDAGNKGKVLWNIQAVGLKPGQKWDVLSIETEEGNALVRGKGGEFLRLDSKLGTVLNYQPGAIIKSLQTTLPVLDASGKTVAIPVMEDGSVGDIPIADFGKGTTLVTKGADNVVNGWTISKRSHSQLTWQFKPSLGEKVTSVTARPSHDPVASIGKALGDRNVLYKYLNPNIILVTAIGRKASTASFYLLDSISGAIISSTSHANVDTDKPVVSAMSENWFAYSLFSESSAVVHDTTQSDTQKLKGYQLVISELYESPYPNDRGSLGSSLNASSLYPTAEDEENTVETPHIITQTFLIPGPISSMSISSTLQGITTRSLLCAIPESKSLISISRAFLDPRRPVGRDPTAAEMEEGLFRYSPFLEFEPKWILSHKRELLSLSEIITSPSLLESTSLVFAFGEIDIFGTRTAPIGAFDILGKGFSKLQLVLTVVALAVGTTVVAPFVRRKQIDGTWKA